MTVAQTQIIDWLGIESGTDHVSLTVVDDLDWSDEQQHLRLLEEKLNAYSAFIESGEVFERLAEDVGRPTPASTPVKVSSLGKYDATSRARAFLDHAVLTFMEAGFTLTHRVVKTQAE